MRKRNNIMGKKQVAMIILTILFVGLISSLMVSSTVSATEHNESTDNQTESVEIGVGQSLSVAVDDVSSSIGQQVSDIARERELGSASSESQRAQVLSKDLNETVSDARETRTEYNKAVNQFNNGEITKSEMITRIAKLSNRADRVESEISNIQYASQFIPEQELNNAGVNQDKIDQARKEIGFVGGDVAKVAKNATLNPGLSISMDANENGMSVAVDSSNGRVYDGSDKDRPDHGQFNITQEEAIKLLSDKYGFNTSEYEVEVDKDDDGYYELEAENGDSEYEAVIDGIDGSFISTEEKGYRGPPEDVGGPENAGPPDRAGPPENPGSNGDDADEEGEDDAEDEEENENRRGPPDGLFGDDRSERAQGSENNSKKGGVADSKRGPPPWAENEVEREEDEYEKESSREEDDRDSYNISIDEAKDVAISELSGDNWNTEDSERTDGLYKFVFNRETSNISETARVEVDASSELVVEKEVEGERKEEAEKPDKEDNEEETESQIGKDEAMKLAEDEAGYNSSNYNVDIDLEDDEYKVTAKSDNGSYIVFIDSKTGEVKDSSFEKKGGNEENKKDTEEKSPATNRGS